MCNQACIDFARANLTAQEVKGKDVLEVGSLDRNGSLRAIVEALQPKGYVGADLSAGPGVDGICPAEDLVPLPQTLSEVRGPAPPSGCGSKCRTTLMERALVGRFGPDAFDVLVATGPRARKGLAKGSR